MSDAPEDPETAVTPAQAARRRRTWRFFLAVGVAALLALLVAGVAGLRYGVLAPQARVLIEARTDGLKLGRIGRLKLEGLSGDIWRDLRIRRLTIRDEKGVWLEARDLHMTWRYTELFRRRFDADLIEAREIRVIRRPTLAPKGKDRGMPVTVDIDRATARLVLEPGFSQTRGVFDLALRLHLARNGSQSGALQARSVDRPGDHVVVDFALPKTRGPLHVYADAEEAQGGALAGAAGLPADQPFRLDVTAEGDRQRGSFSARATSGAVTPLDARGAWSPPGVDAGGHLRLAASRLTAPLAARLGPEVRFGLAARQTRRTLYAVDAKLRAEGLDVHAFGPADLETRALTRSGLRLEARAGSLARLLALQQTLGPVRLGGVVDQPAAGAWRFRGDAGLQAAALGSYRLASISGPVEAQTSSKGLELRARLAGSGGSGQGFAAALLGGAPRAALDLQRRADGQLVVRQIEVQGRGLKVAASGGRSLLGATSVKGRADVSNLAAARPGAAGALAVTWQASQSRPERPWTVGLDARGSGLALGVAELDRLLGRTPRLQADASWRDGRLGVERASLNGAALTATAAGVLDKGNFAFKTDWNATGPFRAGPVEITGKVKGSGAVTGALATPKIDLTATLDAVDIPRLPLRDAQVVLSFQQRPDGSNGTIALTAASDHGPARARSAFRFPRGGVDLTELSVDAGGVRAEGSVSLRRQTASAADLNVQVGPGAFLDAGQASGTLRIVDGAGGPRAALSLQAQGVRSKGSALVIRSARLTADGPLTNLPYTVAAQGASPQGDWLVNGRGTLSEAASVRTVAFDGTGSLGGRSLTTRETAIVRVGGERRSARLRLASSDGGRIDLDGLLDKRAASVRTTVTNMGLGLFDTDFAGRVSGTLNLQGEGSRLGGTLEAQLTGARDRGAPAAQGIDGALTARLDDAALTLEAVTRSAQGLRANANLVLPVETSAAPFRIAIAARQPMRGRFSAEGEVQPLFDLLVGGERSLAGFVRTEGTISGSLARPQATGRVVVERGRFDDGGTGLTLRDVALQATFDERAVNVSSARGMDGQGGQLDGSGVISLLPDGASSFRLNLKSFRLIDNEMATAAATGTAAIRRASSGQVTLTGDLTVDRADISADPQAPAGVVAMDVREINRPEGLSTGLPPRAKRGDGWGLDVRLKAPRRVFLRGRGLDAELSLDAHVTGTTTRPALDGVARIVRGDYDFAGKRFAFDDRGVVYLSTQLQNIRLQLDAVREDPTLTVTVKIRGTAAKPEITLVSSPNLPSDEVLAKVLFERSASQLSPVEAAQLASALSSLAGGGGLDVIGNLRSFAGLDRLAFGGGDQAGVTVSGGKYLTEDIYLEITGGGREGPSAQVEWRIRRNLSILSRIAGQAGNRLAVRWRRDY